MTRSCNSRKVAKTTLCISNSILILSLAIVVVFNAVYNSKLKKVITLEEGSLVSKLWEDIPLPIYQKLYFFNITNIKAFLEGSQPLNVTEFGPYTYKARWFKPNPLWHPNNTVSYREVRTYHFVPEMSNGTQDDVIYTLNAPMIIASNLVRNSSYSSRQVMSSFFRKNGETLIIRKSIRELVYDGYEDAIIKDAPYIRDKMPYKDGKFSWMYGKNDTDDGLFRVFTGVDDASKTNFIKSWNEEEQLSFWEGETCNELKGTSIETGPPIVGDVESYTFFQTIFCRSMTFNYSEDTAHFDIASKRFRPTRDLFANGTENPNNQCFEVNKEHASGVLDISPCQYGAPVFISFPHFHLADSFYLRATNGMNPKDDEHGSYIDVEPMTGLSIDLSVRFQINIEVNKVPDIEQYRGARNGIYPVFWTELSLKLDEKMANVLKSKLIQPRVIAYSLVLYLAGFSLILIIASVLVLAFCSKENKHDKLLMNTKGKENFVNEPNMHFSGDFPHKNTNTTNEYKNTDKSSGATAFSRNGLSKEISYKPAENIYPSKSTENIYS